jgi:hypothetical protein
LASWFGDLPSESTNIDVLQALHNSMAILDKKDYPISTYNGPRDIIFVLGFTLGEIFREELNWSWYYKEVYNDEYIGWMIVSPEKTTAIAVERFFDPPLLYRELENTNILDFFYKIKSEQQNTIYDDKFTVYYSEKVIKYFK